MKTPWASTLAWLLAVSAALILAAASPSERSVMGQLPSLTAHTLTQETFAVPGNLRADRTLALITFRGTQRAHIDGWVEGLKLHADPSIAWVRMPVLNDPGNTAARNAIETKLLHKYPAPAERARLVPVFTDQRQFIRSAALGGPDQVYVVVVNRDGEVLARAQGAFDAEKADNLRETLLQQNF